MSSKLCFLRLTEESNGLVLLTTQKKKKLETEEQQHSLLCEGEKQKPVEGKKREEEEEEASIANAEVIFSEKLISPPLSRMHALLHARTVVAACMHVLHKQQRPWRMCSMHAVSLLGPGNAMDEWKV